MTTVSRNPTFMIYHGNSKKHLTVSNAVFGKKLRKCHLVQILTYMTFSVNFTYKFFGGIKYTLSFFASLIQGTLNGPNQDDRDDGRERQ